MYEKLTEMPSDWQVPDHDVRVLSPKISSDVLVIPVINEGQRIQNQLRNIHALKLGLDVIIADGGSTDGSLEPDFLASVGVRTLITKTGPGKLSAQLRCAYSWALLQGYEGIITVDGNGKDGMEALPEFRRLLTEGYMYIQGSRYRPGGEAENTPLSRTVGNRCVHAPMLSAAAGRWYSDTTNGFRGYSADYLNHPEVRPFRDCFDQYELLFYLTVRAGQLGLKTTETPVRRSYPLDEAVPTKIKGMKGNVDLLKQAIGAAMGRYKP
ncbi:glycosyltransferase family 2 protein [Hellea sp.]|nr:glycosyltransferase family 2 protein [Hellea sp.]